MNLREQRLLRMGRIEAALAGFLPETEPTAALAGQTFPTRERAGEEPVYRFLIIARREDPRMRHISTRSQPDPPLGDGWSLEAVWDLHTGERME